MCLYRWTVQRGSGIQSDTAQEHEQSHPPVRDVSTWSWADQREKAFTDAFWVGLLIAIKTILFSTKVGNRFGTAYFWIDQHKHHSDVWFCLSSMQTVIIWTCCNMSSKLHWIHTNLYQFLFVLTFFWLMLTCSNLLLSQLFCQLEQMQVILCQYLIWEQDCSSAWTLKGSCTTQWVFYKRTSFEWSQETSAVRFNNLCLSTFVYPTEAKGRRRLSLPAHLVGSG